MPTTRQRKGERDQEKHPERDRVAKPEGGRASRRDVLAMRPEAEPTADGQAC